MGDFLTICSTLTTKVLKKLCCDFSEPLSVKKIAKERLDSFFEAELSSVNEDVREKVRAAVISTIKDDLGISIVCVSDILNNSTAFRKLNKISSAMLLEDFVTASIDGVNEIVDDVMEYGLDENDAFNLVFSKLTFK